MGEYERQEAEETRPQARDGEAGRELKLALYSGQGAHIIPQVGTSNAGLKAPRLFHRKNWCTDAVKTNFGPRRISSAVYYI